MKPMLHLLLCMLFLQGHAQDSMPKRLLKYKISVIEWNGAKQTGYLGYINDSILYISTTQVAVNQPAQPISKRAALDFSQIRTIHLKRKGAVGRGILIGAISGLAAGAIAGLVSGDDPACQRSYTVSDPYTGIFTGITYSMCTAFSISAGEKAVIGGTMGMISGGLIGGIIGAVARKKFIITGSKEKFNAMQLSVLERVYGK
jgi:hypothetical protein